MAIRAEHPLDRTGGLCSLHDLNVRIWAWLATHYHKAPHGGG
jgi:hypothetical protein